MKFLGIDFGVPLSAKEYMRRVRAADPRLQPKERAELIREVIIDRDTRALAAIPGSVVYFVQATEGGPVKIGVTTDLSRRLKALQTAQAEPLRVLRWVPGNEAIEAYYHRVFGHLRIQGEWFRFEGDLAGYLDV